MLSACILHCCLRGVGLMWVRARHTFLRLTNGVDLLSSIVSSGCFSVGPPPPPVDGSVPVVSFAENEYVESRRICCSWRVPRQDTTRRIQVLQMYRVEPKHQVQSTSFVHVRVSECSCLGKILS